MEGTEAWDGHYLCFEKVMLALVGNKFRVCEGLWRYGGVYRLHLGSDRCHRTVSKLIYGVLSLTVKEDMFCLWIISSWSTTLYPICVSEVIYYIWRQTRTSADV